jgi:hypothetical protein
MRGYDCACGEYLTGENDQRLLDKMKEHVKQDHPNDDFPEPRLQGMIDTGAYNVQDDSPAAG